jgi:hypothetical protein
MESAINLGDIVKHGVESLINLGDIVKHGVESTINIRSQKLECIFGVVSKRKHIFDYGVK